MRWKRIALLTSATLLLSSSAVGQVTSTHVHFTAAGDYGQGIAAGAVLDTIAAAGPDLNLALGDLSYGETGQEQSWCDFVTRRVGEGFPFQLIAGNHESDGFNGNINDFSACLPNQLPGAVGTYGRQYYVDVPQEDPLLRFVMVSPGLSYPDGTWTYDAGTARYAWTAAAIDGARAAGIPWVVVGMHKPCLSVGVYGCEVGRSFTDMLLAKKVDLVLAGHEHSYQRTKQLGLGPGCTTLAIGSYDPDCVKDGDDDLVAGEGTVFVTIGTGGVSQRDISLEDPEMPYFAAATGLNVNRTFGAGDFDVTPERLVYSFLRAEATGGTLRDAFTITKGTPVPNAPPTAAFASQVTHLTAALDASGSHDSDGLVTSYVWQFGDGDTGTGVSPTHVYSAAGTYQVTLEVTDDDGGTDQVTQPVTVTDPPPSDVVAADAFDRVVGSGWGSADTGGPWSVKGPAGRFSVSEGAGQLLLGSGQSLYADLLSVSTARSLVTAEFSVDKVVEGNYVAVVGRQVGSNAYVARLRLQADGQARLYLLQNFNNVAPSLLVPGLTIRPDDKYRISLEVVGTSPTRLSAKVWQSSAPEPTSWLRTGTSSASSMQEAGHVGVFVYLPSAASAFAPVEVAWHDFRVTRPAP